MVGEARSGRLAELTMALSFATDLGTGQPLGHGLRTCWLSMNVAESLGLDATSRSCVYYMAHLRSLGCVADAAASGAFMGGDDIALNAVMAPIVMGQSLEGVRYFAQHVGEDLPLHRRAGRVARAMVTPGVGQRILTGHCEVAARLAARLRMGDDVCQALSHIYERWDGKGYPDGLAGEAVPVAVRIVAAARDVELWEREAGWAVAAEVLAHRRGHGYDPVIVDVLLEHGAAWLNEIGGDVGAAVLAAEPPPVATIDAEDLDVALAAVADFADLKSAFLRGHSPAVASLVVAAANTAGLSRADTVTLGRAALVHDVGRVGVPSGIWDHPGPLGIDQWERVRLHSYLTERVLQRCTLFAPYAAIAAHHHERVDGSGYHRGASGDQMAAHPRLLAAADAYVAMVADRPHRPALSATAATSELVDEVNAGRFGRWEVDAVLNAIGQTRRSVHVARPASLTEREVDVLRLVARGHSNKQIATVLGISPKTVGHHIEHIYTKTGVTTRAGATVFAMEHRLLSR